MTNSKIWLVTVLLFSVGIAISACGSSVHYTRAINPEINTKHAGPPPHAPAHGYRHKHRDGVELIYKSNIGVYVVVGYTEHYFHKDRYYRMNNGSWEVSRHISKGWSCVSGKKLPPGLRKKQVCRKK